MCVSFLQGNISSVLIPVKTIGVIFPRCVSLEVRVWLPCIRTASTTSPASAGITSAPLPWRSTTSRRTCGAVRGTCLLTTPQARTSRPCCCKASCTCLCEPHRSWWRSTCFAPAVKTPFTTTTTRQTYGPKCTRPQTASGIWAAILNVWWPNYTHSVSRKCFDEATGVVWSCLPCAWCFLGFAPQGYFFFG